MSRLEIDRHAPDGYKAVAALDAYVHTNLDSTLLDLVKLRASQINGCAYCVDMHAADLEKQGVASRKIHAVIVWREAPFFDASERAALALTEEITLIAGGVDDAVWTEATSVFSERELSDLVLAIGTINIWNRIGISTHLSPPPQDD